MDRDIRHHLLLPSGMPDSTTGHRPLVTGHYSRRFQLALALLLTLLVPSAFATPYEVLYDANTDGVFPEDVGWQRFTTQGGANRIVENGLFTLMAQNPSPNGGSDQYIWDAMETLNAGPGEVFFAEWRMRILPGSDSSDVGVFIATDGMQRAFDLAYTDHSMLSSRDNQRIDLDTTIFHTYRLMSFDMIDYTFHIDGDLAWEGFFGLGTTRSSEVKFADFLHASASASQWDFFKFGVLAIPEPQSSFLLIMGCLAFLRRGRTGIHTFHTEDMPCTGPPVS